MPVGATMIPLSASKLQEVLEKHLPQLHMSLLFPPLLPYTQDKSPADDVHSPLLTCIASSSHRLVWSESSFSWATLQAA